MRRGGRIGYIWADDPTDRLVPDAERLQILRAFANQATTALEQAAQFEEIQNAYEHHRALIEASPTAIVDFDLDGRVRSWNTGAATTPPNPPSPCVPFNVTTTTIAGSVYCSISRSATS